MRCENCGEINPEDALYCRKCGSKIENVKKSVVIEEPTTYTHEKTSTSSSSSSDSNWLSCCICIIVIFIVFGIFGAIFHI